jgi:hypothetical protein
MQNARSAISPNRLDWRPRGTQPEGQTSAPPGRTTLNANRLIVGTLAVSMASVATAGPTVLGTPMGGPLGVALGRVLGGTTLGSLLPIAGGGLLIVAAASLMIGISIVRRKKKH